MDGTNSVAMNGTAMAYIEPQQPANVVDHSQVPIRSRSNSPPRQTQQQNRSLSVKNTTTSTGVTQSIHHHHHRRQTTDESIDGESKADLNIQSNASNSSRTRSKNFTPNDDETKLYLKMLVDEMQAMKLEMNKLRQAATPATKTRSDSLQIDLKEMRSHIDLIRARMAMTPRIPEN